MTRVTLKSKYQYWEKLWSSYLLWVALHADILWPCTTSNSKAVGDPPSLLSTGVFFPFFPFCATITVEGTEQSSPLAGAWEQSEVAVILTEGDRLGVISDAQLIEMTAQFRLMICHIFIVVSKVHGIKLIVVVIGSWADQNERINSSKHLCLKPVKNCLDLWLVSS